ncbi:uncharacterized protein [Clytia hemisphaerica]|uniref:uncharacterized protein n=1 Tax=Clytia hemisphaerica TaxID=252671 RepID=UPI0034D44A07
MSRRNLRRIDYKILNSTGQLVEKVATSKESSTEFQNYSTKSTFNEMPSQSAINIKVLIQEVADTIDENPVEPGADYKDVIERLIELRKSIRSNEQTLVTETPDPILTTTILETLNVMKNYIKDATRSKRHFQMVQAKQESDAVDRKEKSLLFSIKDSKNSIEELITQFSRQPKDCSNEELMDMKSNLSSHINLVNETSKRLESISSAETNNETTTEAIQHLLERYDHLTLSKSVYIRDLNKEIDDRQVYKQKLFSESNLNIKLEKFSGYSDGIDIYTFKSKFEKLHLKTTPKHLLADLLKNNYLKEPALSCVKTQDDIDEIWDRLNQAYGNVMLILQRKINQLTSSSSIQRSKDTGSIIESMTNIVNLIKDLTSLAREHHVENYLYYGVQSTKSITCLVMPGYQDG